MKLPGRTVLSWALYDWANSAFATTVMAGFFPLFFSDYWGGGQSQLAKANSLSSLTVALLVLLATRLSRWQASARIELPLAWPGVLSATVLTFAHTLGEFGVVLMVGGNIPGKTKVISIAIYEHVETIRYAEAQLLSGGLLIFSFLVLLLVYSVNRRFPVHVG